MVSPHGDSAASHADSGPGRRREERRDCFAPATLKCASGEFPCAINDIAMGGVGLTLGATSAKLIFSESIVVTSEIFGSIRGVVRWSAHPRYGIEIEDAATKPPGFDAFFESLSGERILAERMKFIGFDEVSRRRLLSLKPLIEREAGAGVDTFYRHVRADSSAQAMFSDERQFAQARDRQVGHWKDISEATFDAAYFQTVRRVGLGHAQMGVEPRWYIAGYAHVLEHLVQAALRENWPRNWLGRPSAAAGEDLAATLGALIKATFIDMDVALGAHRHAAEEARLKGEAQAIWRERTMVTDSIGLGLAKLAQKDLSHRIEEDLPDAYASLKNDFNVAIGQLAEALGKVVVNAEAVHGGMQDISTASQELAARADQQAAQIERTSVSLNEITSSVAKTAAEAREAQTAMLAAQAEAERSGEVVQRSVVTMGKISSSSQEIGQIVSLVDEIAFQTNLLALNAGVEAARAGDVGRGFAVVASEVRALALRSADAAKQIRSLIATSTVHVKEGVALVAEAGDSLGRIVEHVTTINRGIADIAQTASAQADGLRHVSEAVSQIGKVTQQNTQMAEQATSATVDLLRDSEQLAGMIGQFEISGAGAAMRAQLRRAGAPGYGATLRRSA